MTRDDAYQLIRSLARTELEMRVKDVSDTEPPNWTLEAWRADAEGEGRTSEAAEIAEAIRILTPAGANKVYRDAWYQGLKGY